MIIANHESSLVFFLIINFCITFVQQEATNTKTLKNEFYFKSNKKN